MGNIERAYKDGQAVGYYIPANMIKLVRGQSEARIVMSHAARRIVVDYLSDRCHICMEALPAGITRRVCLNCLAEQSSMALTEASNRGNLIEYLVWKEGQSQPDRYGPDLSTGDSIVDVQLGDTKDSREAGEHLPPVGSPPEDDYYWVSPGTRRRQGGNMIVFKINVNRISPDRVVLTLRADDEPIGHLLLSPRVCRALVSRLFGDEQKGGEYVILEPDEEADRLS